MLLRLRNSIIIFSVSKIVSKRSSAFASMSRGRTDRLLALDRVTRRADGRSTTSRKNTSKRGHGSSRTDAPDAAACRPELSKCTKTTPPGSRTAWCDRALCTASMSMWTPTWTRLARRRCTSSCATSCRLSLTAASCSRNNRSPSFRSK